jgi:hypothetical protein
MRFVGILAALILVGCHSTPKPPRLIESRFIEPADFDVFLDKPPNGRTAEGKPNGIVSITYYATIKGAPHLLLVSDSKDSLFGFFEGDMDSKGEESETVEESFIRVCNEHSAGMITLNREDMHRGMSYMSNDHSNTLRTILFVPTTQNYRKSDLLKAQNSCKGDNCNKIDDIVWVPVKQLLGLSSDDVEMPADNARVIKLKPTLRFALMVVAFRKILMDIERKE